MSKNSGLGENVRMIVHAIVIALVIRTFFFQPFNIPSGSLIPTLLVGDYLFVSKFTYGYSRYSFPFAPNLFSGRIADALPNRGEIIVFRNLKSPDGDDYIKRVIGLPGDKIQMLDGRLHINGQPLERQSIGTYPSIDSFGKRIDVPMYKEIFPDGQSHVIIERDADQGYWDNTFEYVVPAGHYFMMGDNRDNSTDSRDQRNVGFVPHEALIGRAQIIFFSIRESSEPWWALWTWPERIRFERIGGFIR